MKYPKHMATSSREWKALKRKQWKAVRLAMNEFQTGCAYTPVYDEFCKMQNKAKGFAEEMSAKNWGR